MATPKEKKEYAIIGVMLVATLLVIYFNFMKPKGNSVPVATAPVPGGPIITPTGGTAAPVPGGATVGIPTSSTTFLPAGTSLDLNVLDDKHFKALVPPVYPQVTPDEIGSTDVFGGGSSASSSLIERVPFLVRCSLHDGHHSAIVFAF